MLHRRVSDRALRRWLATGRPRRVERAIDVDPSVAVRLEAMTALDDVDSRALTDLVKPSEEFEARAVLGVHRRRDASGVAAVLGDLLGLGFHVGRAMFEDPAESDDGRD